MSTLVEVAGIETPVGQLQVAARDARVLALGFTDGWDDLQARVARALGDAEFAPADAIPGVTDRLHDYLAGDLTALGTIAVEPHGTTFQKRVWSALQEIPAGTTASYAEIAAAIGQPAAMRAVGSANGKNLISIVIPCHRVIRNDGSIGGYGWGLQRKRWLLAHEQCADVA